MPKTIGCGGGGGGGGRVYRRGKLYIYVYIGRVPAVREYS